MDEQHKRSQVNFECNKGQDYSFKTVEKLVKSAYNEIGKPNPFDANYRDSTEEDLKGEAAKQPDDP